METLEGQGELENWEQPDKRIPARYLFDITTKIVEQPGFPPVVASRHSNGDIRPLAGEDIAEGYYWLFASAGEILRVKNPGFMCVILSS